MTHTGEHALPTGRTLRIALWGHFGALNLGNECTLAAAIHNLRARHPGVQLSCISSYPADTEQRHGLPSVALRSRGDGITAPALPKFLRRLWWLGVEARAWFRAWRHAGKYDALVVAGTGVLTDSGEGALGLPYEIFKWVVTTKLRGRKVVFLSVGTEAIRSGATRFFLRHSVRLADFCSFRDQHSKDRIEAIGGGSKSHVFPDLAFSLPAPQARSAPTPGVLRVGVGVYNFRDRGAGGEEEMREYEGYLDTISSFVVWLHETGREVRLVIGDVAYDQEVLGDVLERLRKRGFDTTKIHAEPIGSYQDLFQQLAEIDVLVATRFHNLLLCLFFGKPCVSLSHETKNEAVMATMNLRKYCQTLEDLQLRTIIDHFEDLLLNLPKLGPTIVATADQQRVLLDQQYTALSQLLSGRG